MEDLFFDFKQAENKKELELVSLRKEVEELKSLLTESYQKKVEYDTIIYTASHISIGPSGTIYQLKINKVTVNGIAIHAETFRNILGLTPSGIPHGNGGNNKWWVLPIGAVVTGGTIVKAGVTLGSTIIQHIKYAYDNHEYYTDDTAVPSPRGGEELTGTFTYQRQNLQAYKEICRNCEENHTIRDCTKECNGSCPRSYKSHIPKECPARLLSDDL